MVVGAKGFCEIETNKQSLIPFGHPMSVVNVALIEHFKCAKRALAQGRETGGGK